MATKAGPHLLRPRFLCVCVQRMPATCSRWCACVPAWRVLLPGAAPHPAAALAPAACNQGTYSKVKYGQHVGSGEAVAVKVLDKEHLIRTGG